MTKAETDIKYYILFSNYNQGLALREILLKHGIKSKIAPTPRDIDGYVPCGMSLMLDCEVIEEAKKCIEENKGEYLSIVALENQIKSKRDRYC